MLGLNNFHLPKPTDWDAFERIVCSVAQIRFDNPDFTLHGRKGQAQDGVDIYGRGNSGKFVGLQCKNTTKGISNALISKEVALAEKFEPPLGKLYIATSAETDASNQDFVRRMSEERLAQGKFEVHILFWREICDELGRDPPRMRLHFPFLDALPVLKRPSSHDQDLFNRFQSDLPLTPTIRLLSEHDFRFDFKEDSLSPLQIFVDAWRLPDAEFIDPVLKQAFSDLYCEACAASNCISERAVPIGTEGKASVYSDFARAQKISRGHFKQEAREMNEAAQAFASRYCEFVQLCRSRLAT